MSTGKIKAAPEWDRGAAVVFVRWFGGWTTPVVTSGDTHWTFWMAAENDGERMAALAGDWERWRMIRLPKKAGRIRLSLETREVATEPAPENRCPLGTSAMTM